MKPSVDSIVSNLLNQKLSELETHFNADVLVYYGPFEGGENQFLSIVEDLAKDANKKEVFKTETMNYLLANKSASYDLNNIRISNPKNYYVQLFTDKNDKMVELKFSD